MNNTVWIIIGAIVLVLIALTIKQSSSRGDSSHIPVSGNIEVTEVNLSFRLPGYLAERLVDEGDVVKKNAVVAKLDSKELEQEVAMRQAEVAAAQAALDELSTGFLPDEIAQGNAKVRQAESELERTKSDFQRQEKLFNEKVISKREFDASKAAYEVAQGRVTESRKSLSLLEKGARHERITQSESKLKQSQEALELAQTRLGYATLSAPQDGWVLSKSAEAGEFVFAGTPIVTIGNLSDTWFRGYISETDLGRIKLNDPVAVTTDTYPGKKYQGKVSFISSEAEFTPKNVQTAEERVKLVYRIKVALDNPSQELKPGMPAEGLITIHP